MDSVGPNDPDLNMIFMDPMNLNPNLDPNMKNESGLESDQGMNTRLWIYVTVSPEERCLDGYLLLGGTGYCSCLELYFFSLLDVLVALCHF